MIQMFICDVAALSVRNCGAHASVYAFYDCVLLFENEIEWCIRLSRLYSVKRDKFE